MPTFKDAMQLADIFKVFRFKFPLREFPVAKEKNVIHAIYCT